MLEMRWKSGVEEIYVGLARLGLVKIGKRSDRKILWIIDDKRLLTDFIKVKRR